jgi:hypothetical protein
MEELASEPDERRARRLAGQRCDDARVEAAADVSAYRHVGPEVDARRVLEERQEPFLKVAGGVAQIEVVIDLPVPLFACNTTLDRECVPCRQFAHALEQRFSRQTELEG